MEETNLRATVVRVGDALHVSARAAVRGHGPQLGGRLLALAPVRRGGGHRLGVRGILSAPGRTARRTARRTASKDKDERNS